MENVFVTCFRQTQIAKKKEFCCCSTLRRVQELAVIEAGFALFGN